MNWKFDWRTIDQMTPKEVFMRYLRRFLFMCLIPLSLLLVGIGCRIYDLMIYGF